MIRILTTIGVFAVVNLAWAIVFAFFHMIKMPMDWEYAVIGGYGGALLVCLYQLFGMKRK